MQKGNIRPRDRVLFLVHDFVAEEKTGKGILTEADKFAIAKGWVAKNNTDAKEYNRYAGAWKTEGRLRMEAHLTYLNGTNSLLLANRVIDFAMWREKKDLGALEKLELAINPHEALDLILKNSGLCLEETIYRFAFQNLKESVRERILEIYPDAATEREYLEEQEKLATLFGEKTELSTEEKIGLANLIVAPLDKYSKVASNGGLGLEKIFLITYFADLPLIEVAKKWSRDHGIVCEDGLILEKITEYSKEIGTSFKEILKGAVLSWLDKGLFVSEYAPICNSDQRDVFKAWIEEKSKAKSVLEKLIAQGSLVIENRNKDSFGLGEAVEIINGESLYYLEGNFSFAEDFRNQADKMRVFGSIILFLKSRDFLEHYSILLGFSEIYERLSEIFEVELDHYLEIFLKSFEESLSSLVHELTFIAEKFQGATYSEGAKFQFEFFAENIFDGFKNVDPAFRGRWKHYTDEFGKDFRLAFEDKHGNHDD